MYPLTEYSDHRYVAGRLADVHVASLRRCRRRGPGGARAGRVAGPHPRHTARAAGPIQRGRSLTIRNRQKRCDPTGPSAMIVGGSRSKKTRGYRPRSRKSRTPRAPAEQQRPHRCIESNLCSTLHAGHSSTAPGTDPIDRHICLGGLLSVDALISTPVRYRSLRLLCSRYRRSSVHPELRRHG
jgi:hypothetical protein